MSATLTRPAHRWQRDSAPTDTAEKPAVIDQRRELEFTMEQCAIGATLMLCAAPTKRALSRLRPPHFSRKLHRTVWAALLRLEDRRQHDRDLVSIDIVSAVDELRRAGKLDECGGVAYLQACIELTPAAENIDYYISRVIEASQLRFLRLVAVELTERLAEPDADGDQLRVSAMTAMQTIEQHGYAQVKEIFEKAK